MGTTFFIGIITRPGNYDSLTYHLARVGFWIQNGTINHYPTWAEIQNLNPVNAEIGLLWIILFTGSDNITFISQWIALIVILIAVYKLLRLINLSKIVSLISALLFINFDIVILEAISTQNDLILAVFVILSVIFLLKSLQNDKPEYRYLIITGLTLGFMISLKGSSYIFIPGIAILIFLINKNNKIKFIKIGYLLLFSISGVFIFASYHFIQNYIDYGNIFSSKDYAGALSISNPDLKTFISNISRHFSSFYQYYSIDHDTVGNLIMKMNNNLHSKIGLAMDSSRTTYPGALFDYSPVKLNYDESYFGPLFFFLVLPSFFYSVFLFLVLRIWKKGKELIQKYKDSLKLYLIGLSFFLCFVFIFRWQPFSGRLLIGFALFSVAGFAINLEFIKCIKLRYLFDIISCILIIPLMTASFFPLFKTDYTNLSKFDFKVEYNNRNTNFIKDGQDLAYSTFGDKYKLGLILREGDAVYLLFGNKFENKLIYISKESWDKEKISDIIQKNNIDGILVNKNAEAFLEQKITPLSKKLTKKLLFVIDKKNYKDFISANNGSEFIESDDSLILKSKNNDPGFEIIFDYKQLNEKSLVVGFNIKSDNNGEAQVFYKWKGKSYNEQDSEKIKIIKGDNNFYVKIDNISKLESIRLDPINFQADTILKSIEFRSVDDTIRYKTNGSYVLFY
ncbi:MAG: glycosyltransferase family 39 protein [Actinobacteria bacterium]|nr:glycosyltransferase family 39 protein [Actinomycetota bacterium]